MKPEKQKLPEENCWTGISILTISLQYIPQKREIPIFMSMTRDIWLWKTTIIC
jgi:hypothetical protein